MRRRVEGAGGHRRIAVDGTRDLAVAIEPGIERAYDGDAVGVGSEGIRAPS